MKTLIRTISLTLLSCIVVLNAFGQKKTPKPNNTPTTVVDTTKKTNPTAPDTSKKTDTTNPGSKKKPTQLAADSPKKVKPDTNGMGQLLGKTFIFNQNLRITECSSNGENILNASRPVAIRGYKFLVTKVLNDNVVILFYISELKKSAKKYAAVINDLNNADGTLNLTNLTPKEKETFADNEKAIFEQRDIIARRGSFNFKQLAEYDYVPSTSKLDSGNSNRYFFLLPKDSLNEYCTLYKDTKYWNINYGTLVTPFKLRFNKFSFSNNLSVGGAVYFQHKFDTDWSWGSVFALSLSSVTLDAASTNLHTTPLLTSSTTRPAFSPSLHGVISYNNISFTLGIGFDYLSKPTDIATATNPEAGWIYNGKPWLGIGLGISLFSNSSSSANTTKAVPGQDKVN